MNEGALALLIHGGTENWSPERWKRRFDEVCKNRRVWLLPDAACEPGDISYFYCVTNFDVDFFAFQLRSMGISEVF